MANVQKQLTEVLQEQGLITPEQLIEVVQEEIESGKSAWRILLERGAVTERDLVMARAVQFDMPFVDARRVSPDAEALRLVPAEVARRQLALPVHGRGEELLVAMAEPHNHLATSELQAVSGKIIRPAAAYRPDLSVAIDRWFGEGVQPAAAQQAPPAQPRPLAPPAAAHAAASVHMGAGAPAVPAGRPGIPQTPMPQAQMPQAQPGVQPYAQPAPRQSPAAHEGAATAPPGAAPPGARTMAGNGAFGSPGMAMLRPEEMRMSEARRPGPVATPSAQETGSGDGPNLASFLEAVIDGGASDLHLTAGIPPMIRVHGDLRPIQGFRKLEPRDLQEMLYSILTQKQREIFEENLELDLSYSLPGRARFRVNVFQQRDSMGSVMRLIPYEIKNVDELGIPKSVKEFTKLRRGLVLVTGITGSGKSTTLASLVDVINSERSEHIMTVEDPIEFLHNHKKSVVNQREVGADTHGFASALKHVLRQDPDVILVGELRDLETISTALTAAETGHLVFATLHTQDAPQSVDRVIDVFPPHQQQQIRIQLAGTLAGVVSQQLLPRSDRRGRAVACEVLVATPAVRNLIREGKTHQIYTSMQAGGKFGMQVMDQHLAELVKKGIVTYEVGIDRCHKVEEFNRLVGKG